LAVLHFGAWQGARGQQDDAAEPRCGASAHRPSDHSPGEWAGDVLVIQGAAGIDKSALLRVLGQCATGQGIQTLTAQASELKREFGFALVRQLLERRMARTEPVGLCCLILRRADHVPRC